MDNCGWQLSARSPWAGLKDTLDRNRWKKHFQRLSFRIHPRKRLSADDRKQLGYLLK
jgi:hypothetical protein